MTSCENPLSRSLLGVKRTSSFAAQMSASGPKAEGVVVSGAITPVLTRSVAGQIQHRELSISLPSSVSSAQRGQLQFSH